MNPTSGQVRTDGCSAQTWGSRTRGGRREDPAGCAAVLGPRRRSGYGGSARRAARSAAARAQGTPGGVDAVEAGGVAAEDPGLHLGGERRVAEALLGLGGDLEGPERLDLVLRRAVPDRVGAPQRRCPGPSAASSLPSTWAAWSGSPMSVRHVDAELGVDVAARADAGVAQRLEQPVDAAVRRPGRTAPRTAELVARVVGDERRSRGGRRRPARRRPAVAAGRPLCTHTIGGPISSTSVEEAPRPIVVVEAPAAGRRACTTSTPRSGSARPRLACASSAASSRPTFGWAWPCTSTRPSPHSSSAARGAPRPSPRPTAGRGRRATGMAESTAIVVSRAAEHQVEPVLGVEAGVGSSPQPRLRERRRRSRRRSPPSSRKCCLHVEHGRAVAPRTDVATSGSVVDSGGTSNVPGRRPAVVLRARAEASSVAADAIERAEEVAPRHPEPAGGVVAGGPRQPGRGAHARRHGRRRRTRRWSTAPSLMGRPGSSCRSDRRTSAVHPDHCPARAHTDVARPCQYLSRRRRV